jgi:hypothetical protein
MKTKPNDNTPARNFNRREFLEISATAATFGMVGAIPAITQSVVVGCRGAGLRFVMEKRERSGTNSIDEED